MSSPITLESAELSEQDMAVVCSYIDLTRILHKLETVGLALDWQAQARRTLEDVAHAFPELQLDELVITN